MKFVSSTACRTQCTESSLFGCFTPREGLSQPWKWIYFLFKPIQGERQLCPRASGLWSMPFSSLFPRFQWLHTSLLWKVLRRSEEYLTYTAETSFTGWEKTGGGAHKMPYIYTSVWSYLTVATIWVYHDNVRIKSVWDATHCISDLFTYY